MPPPEPALALPWITPDLPGVGGVLRLTPDSFVVEEIPLYAASGEGMHLYVCLTKVNLTTREVQSGLEKLFGAPRGSVGYAGLKDKAARTTQTFSIPVDGLRPGIEEEMAARIAGELPVEVHWARLHTNKLKAGHLLGNRFEVTIHGVHPSPSAERGGALKLAQTLIARLRAVGVPNYFGPQRFGGQGDNAVAGWEIVMGVKRVRDPWLRRLLVSSYQSHLCNLYLARRVERGLFPTLMTGDIAKKHDTGGMFDVEDADVEQVRFDAGEISFTAPLFGSKMRRAKAEAAALESAIEAETGLTDSDWRRVNTEGTRRMGRLLVADLAVEESGESLICRFTLPKGGFATTVLAEIMKANALDLPAQESE